MPDYLYKCHICKRTQETTHSMQENPNFACCDLPMFIVIQIPHISQAALVSQFKSFLDQSSGKMITSHHQVKAMEAKGQTLMKHDEALKYARHYKKENEKKEKAKDEKELGFYAHKLSKGEKCTDTDGTLIPAP